MTASLILPGRILLGRGAAAQAPGIVLSFGRRIVVVHGRDGARAAWLPAALADRAKVLPLSCAGEPTLDDLTAALPRARAFAPDVVVGLGGGAALDLAKALAALIPAPGDPLDHLEVVGRALPLAAAPLPFVAIPTTAGTGAEATRNAVIGVPAARRKVSLRDDRMVARVALVDPALTDHCPRGVTMASGLDAVVQAIEPYLSNRANPLTDAICRDAIPRGLAAIRRLAGAEDPAARDAMAFVSLSGGIALSGAGLGAVHGLAGVLGGRSDIAHGALCGALLVPVLRLWQRIAPTPRLAEVEGWIGAAFGGADPLERLDAFVRAQALLPDAPPWTGDETAIAQDALASSSMKASPVLPDAEGLRAVLADLVPGPVLRG